MLHPKRRKLGITPVVLLLLAASWHPVSARTGELRLGIGDVIEVAVAGSPDLKTRSTIDQDGNLSVPFLGTIEADGRSLAEVRAQVQRGLPERVFQRRSGDTLASGSLVQPQDILVSIAEYRPIYVGGDVIKPGEYAFRPGLTARQAIVLAGDYDLLGVGARLNPIERLRFKREFNEALTDLGRLEIKARRLRAQLSDDPFDAQAASTTPELAEFSRMEAERLQRDRMMIRTSLQQIDNLLEKTREQLVSLKALLGQQEEGMRRQTAELENLRALLQRGITSQNRLGEEQRAQLFLSERTLQTTARIQEMETRIAELGFQRRQNEQDWRQKALAELQDVEGQLARLRVATKGRGEIFDSAQAFASESESGPQIVIDRMRGEVGSLVAGEGTIVIPGDIITVRVGGRRSSPGGQVSSDGGGRRAVASGELPAR